MYCWDSSLRRLSNICKARRLFPFSGKPVLSDFW